MKKFVFVALVSSLSIALHSCCKLCTVDYSNIKFYGFNANEMDSISIVKYEAGTAVIKDSIPIYVANDGDHFSYRLTEKIRDDYDYHILMHKAKQTHEITDVTIDTRKCDCDETEYLRSYALNGEGKEGNIEIHK